MNGSEMLHMLELASIAYRDNQPLCHCSKVILVEDKETDTECFVRIRNENVSITFRGTDSRVNCSTTFALQSGHSL